MAITRLRTLPTKSTDASVDREARVIRGVSCAQAVEALGHGLLLDDITLEQIAEQGNAAKAGIKSRFTHPGLSSDGLGKYLGRLREFRVDGDKVLANLHISDLASKSPSGDLGSYVMNMAEEEPDMLGLSVVMDPEPTWELEGGGSISAKDAKKRPENATTDKPVIRVKKFVSCDVVDEPAANRDGMFSSALWATNQLSEQMYGDIDNLLAEYQMSPEKVFEFALKYCHARNVNLKEFAMADESTVEVTELQDDGQIEDMRRELAALRATVAEEVEARQDAEQRASTVEAALDSSNERVARLETAARDKRFAELSADWFGDVDHVKMLSSIADVLGEDSDEFAAYVKQQNAVAETVMSSELLQEFGTSRQGDDRSAANQLESKAQELMAADSDLTHAQAFAKAAEQNTDLYRQHKQEMRG